MKILVLGTGCKRCDDLYNNTVEALNRIQISDSLLEKVGDPEVFLRLKVFMTPALVIDDEVISTGKVLTPEQIQEELAKRIGA